MLLLISSNVSFASVLVLDIRMSANPIIIQTTSRIRIIIPMKIPADAGIPTLFSAKASPPSLVPNCIGKKKIRLANKDEPELIIRDCTILIFKPIAFAVQKISRQPTTLAINSKANDLKKRSLLCAYNSVIWRSEEHTSELQSRENLV